MMKTEEVLNLIFFYKNIDKETFDKHKGDWVLIYNQKVKKEYMSKELNDFEDKMPNAIYLPVDKSIQNRFIKGNSFTKLHQ